MTVLPRRVAARSRPAPCLWPRRSCSPVAVTTTRRTTRRHPARGAAPTTRRPPTGGACCSRLPRRVPGAPRSSRSAPRSRTRPSSSRTRTARPFIGFRHRPRQGHRRQARRQGRDRGHDASARSSPGLDTKRIDLIMSAMSDNKDRQTGMDEGKKVGEGIDFVDYFDAGGLDPGARRATRRTSRPWTTSAARPSPCRRRPRTRRPPPPEPTSARPTGKGAITTSRPTSATTRPARSASSRAPRWPTSATSRWPLTPSQTGGGNDFEVVGEQIEPGPARHRRREEQQPAARRRCRGAVEPLIADGTYGKILEKWNVARGAVTEVQARQRRAPDRAGLQRHLARWPPSATRSRPARRRSAPARPAAAGPVPIKAIPVAALRSAGSARSSSSASGPAGQRLRDRQTSTGTRSATT